MGSSVLNFNIGVLGHVDSGKTSLSKVLSTVASTASFDKNPQSRERGITLDLGFSSFAVDVTEGKQEELKGYKTVQYTLVDCPGHASLIRTIIGGAQIIDLMLLVVDITKGMQTQTAECLVIGEITCSKMIVVLNKLDMIPPDKQPSTVDKMKKRMWKTLEATKFANCPIVAVAAKPGGPEAVDTEAVGIKDLMLAIKNSTYLPSRSEDGPFIFSVDHCFSIRGQGTVMTGTVLSGKVCVNDPVEIPSLGMSKKVKSIQMFHTPFEKIKQMSDPKLALMILNTNNLCLMCFISPRGRRPWKRILLFGPPGTGKSRLAHAVSAEVQATFYCVSSTDLISSWVGESEKLIKELFHHANNQHGQSVIFIDEIDSLCRHRSSQEDEGTRRIKTELLIQMDGADRNSEEKIFLLCATNCPWDLDTAFLRRFQKRIYISLPDHTSRIELMKLHCKGIQVNMVESAWKQLASQTHGYSGSDLSTLTKGALLRPVRDLQIATHWMQTPDGKWLPTDARNKQAMEARITDLPAEKICPRDVTIEDFLASMQIHGPTVSESELKKFSNFTLSYGQTG